MMTKSALPMVILITNTADSYVSSAIYDGLVMQYCRNDVAFNVISICKPDNFRLGISSDYLALKDATKATGGIFIEADSLITLLPDIFNRRIFKRKNYKEKYLIEEYSTNLLIDHLLDCRLREGFAL